MPDNTQILASNEGISSYVITRAASEVTFRANEARSLAQERWSAIVDTLLRWLVQDASQAADAPSSACIQSAIDLVIDSQENSSVPTSIALTGDGGVGFEWRMGDEIITIEVVASGLAEFTRFRKGRVIQEALLKRNPRTRRLEMRGPCEE
jgi:hypothetical protein